MQITWSCRLIVRTNFNIAVLLLALVSPRAAQASEQGGVMHFEKYVRPILLEHCISCHGPEKQESGLRLDSLAGAVKGGELYGSAIDLEMPDRSMLFVAIRRDGDLAMPPKTELGADEIRAIKTWLKSGASWPEHEDASARLNPEDAWRTHWASQPVLPQEIPAVLHADRVYSQIDAFVLKQLESEKLEPAAIADARTLIRRLHFVLVGLPPSRMEIEAFTDLFVKSPRQAMQEAVDRLLDSPHYGERWARHWLDTKGYVRLQEQPNYYYAYTYRDYVVQSFNDDLPYDQFVLEQLAADQLVSGDDNRRFAALGFLTLGRRFTGNQHDVVDDRIDVVTRGFMALTVTCARCHDHKFDPIPIEDYYALYGVFASTSEPSDLPYLGRHTERSVFHGDMQAYREKRSALDKQINQHLPATLDMLRADTTRYLQGVLIGRKRFLVPLPAAKGELRQTFVERWVEYLEGTKRGTHPVFELWHVLRALPEAEFEARAAMALNESRSNVIIHRALRQAKLASMRDVADVYGRELVAIHQKWTATRRADPTAAKLLDSSEEPLRQVLYGEDSPFAVSPREALDAYLLDAELNRDLSQAYLDFDAWLIGTGQAADRAHVLFDSSRLHEPHVFVRGNPERTGRRVPRAPPRLLGEPLCQPFVQGSGRLELAKSIVSPANPLTARVIVNRVWKNHFGQGLVSTASNFGLRAEPPTHPALLDYLAHRFMSEGWSLKKLHRWILLSSTWQQASVDRPECRRVDPENRLLWRTARRRMDFETLRDTLLHVGGNLDLTLGGPPISLLASGNTRRTIYGRIDRSRLPTILRLFDFPSPDTHSPNRARTTAPQQALYLLNNPFVMKQSAALAERAAAASSESRAAVGQELYWLTLGRPATEAELDRCRGYLEQGGAWAELAQALLVSNEFLFID